MAKMDESTFRNLLPRLEDETVDFKREGYEFGGADKQDKMRKRGQFVKDIIAMYNTPREHDAHVVLGVEKRADGTWRLHGLVDHPDDAMLRDQFKDIVYPRPAFRYEPISIEGKEFAVITIPVDRTTGPCVPSKEVLGLLRRHQLYTREGSQNVAAPSYRQKQIYEWFSGADASSEPIDLGEPAWDAFLRQVDRFDPSLLYILAATRLVANDSTPLSNFGHIDWSFVFDFDPDSSDSGLLSEVEPVLSERRGFHVLVKGNQLPIRAPQSTHWYFARGKRGLKSSLSEGRFLDWQAAYDTDLREQLRALAKATAGRPCRVIAVWDDLTLQNHLQSFLAAVVATFGDTAQIALVHHGAEDEYSSVAAPFEAHICRMPIHQLAYGLSYLRGSQTSHRATFPSSAGAPIEIDDRQLAWLEEEIEVVHRDIGRRPPPGRIAGVDFLRGNEISWYELALRCDVERDQQAKVEARVRDDLRSRIARRINLYHGPGAGGTTLVRRILWQMRNEHPTVILNSCSPETTIERITFIGALTGKSILVEADSAAISESDVDALYALAVARHLPIVILNVCRRFHPPKDHSRAFYLPAELSDHEAAAFVHSLQLAKPDRMRDLKAQLELANPTEKTAFLLALTAFGRDFVGLEGYVAARLDGLNEVQKRVMVYFALAHYYGQQGIRANFFSAVLHTAPAQPLDLAKALPEATLELMVMISPDKWRTAHHLVAEACLQHLLGTHGSERGVWRQRLSASARDFINFAAAACPVVSDEAVELVKRVFVFRDNADVLGTEKAASRGFSRLIKDIPTESGRVETLRELTAAFPNEAHFWAHLGRFYAYTLQEFKSAGEAIDKSILLAPTDNVLHHMKGMAIRGEVYDCIARKESVVDVCELAENASKSFSESRRLNPEDQHGYISEAQMVVRVLDYCGRTTGGDAIVAVTSSSAPDWLRGALEIAEALLAAVRRDRYGEAPSEYEVKCRTDLDILYGRHEEALQRCQNLLDRGVVAPEPIRRQIVWTHLSRAGRNWREVPVQKIRRIVTLLDANLEAEPGDERNMRLWIRAIRYLEPPPTMHRILEQVGYWKANADSLDAIYYLFVLNALEALGDASLARDRMDRALEECRERARYRRNRTNSSEWLGHSDGIARLVPADSLGRWDRDTDYWQDSSTLSRQAGTIIRIRGPHAGEIELAGGVRAFFVPGRSGHARDRDENKGVTCHVGLSYEGPRAWAVETA